MVKMEQNRTSILKMGNNEMVRKTAKKAGVYLWELGDYLGVSENTVIRWLRKPLDSAKEVLLLNAISEVAARKAKANVDD